MKLYKPKPQPVLRISIHKQGEPTMYLSVCEVTQQAFYNWAIKKLEKIKISAFTSGVKVSVTVRESLGGKNGKSKSFNLRGLSTEQVYNILLKGIEANETKSESPLTTEIEKQSFKS